jgi:glycosyltransferase involved in cell wall biosynthesis
VIALDCATPQTRAWFCQPALSHWRVLDLDKGDLGRARNHVVPLTRGRFIAFLDADDLFSPNWLCEGVKRLQALSDQGIRAIVHPELNWLFDGAQGVFCKPDQDDPLFVPQYFYFMNYYDSLCLAPREAHLQHPYVHRDIPAGLSFQDWQFAIETMAAGWRHVSAKDTSIFKRRRDASLVTESRARRALVRMLPAMRIDQVADLGRCDPLPGSEPDSNISPDPIWGQALQRRADHARGLRGREADHPAYDLIRAHFDYEYYLATGPDLLAFPNMDLVSHYIRAGAREGRDPTPWFGTRAYAERYGDTFEPGQNPFHHYLSTGRDQGHLTAPFSGLEDLAGALGLTAQAAQDIWWGKKQDLKNRLLYGALGHQVKAAAQFDPLIEQGWLEALAVKIPGLHSHIASARTSAMIRLQRAAGQTPARYVICVNRARFGGAKRLEGQIAQALAERHGADQLLLITTDHPGGLPQGKLPAGARHVDFAALVTGLDEEQRQRVLAEFLRSLAPEAMFNINSRLMWDVMTPYGTALGASMRLYGGLLCEERTALDAPTGYPLKRFYRHFDQLSAVMTDSHALADELRSRHMLPPAQAGRVAVLSNPVDPSIPIASQIVKSPRPQIFWAGRFDPQKRPELLAQIARALPNCDFRLWGAQVMGQSLPDWPENVSVEGVYAHLTDLPLDQADLWLYTSGWDGVPMMLLEAAMTGIPILGSAVGGTVEVLPEEWRMDPQAGAEDWANAIRQSLKTPIQRRKQALNLRESLITQRSPAQFAAQLFNLPGMRA